MLKVGSKKRKLGAMHEAEKITTVIKPRGGSSKSSSYYSSGFAEPAMKRRVPSPT